MTHNIWSIREDDCDHNLFTKNFNEIAIGMGLDLGMM